MCPLWAKLKKRLHKVEYERVLVESIAVQHIKLYTHIISLVCVAKIEHWISLRRFCHRQRKRNTHILIRSQVCKMGNCTEPTAVLENNTGNQRQKRNSEIKKNSTQKLYYRYTIAMHCVIMAVVFKASTAAVWNISDLHVSFHSFGWLLNEIRCTCTHLQSSTQWRWSHNLNTHTHAHIHIRKAFRVYIEPSNGNRSPCLATTNAFVNALSLREWVPNAYTLRMNLSSFVTKQRRLFVYCHNCIHK